MCLPLGTSLICLLGASLLLVSVQGGPQVVLDPATIGSKTAGTAQDSNSTSQGDTDVTSQDSNSTPQLDTAVTSQDLNMYQADLAVTTQDSNTSHDSYIPSRIGTVVTAQYMNSQHPQKQSLQPCPITYVKPRKSNSGYNFKDTGRNFTVHVRKCCSQDQVWSFSKSQCISFPLSTNFSFEESTRQYFFSSVPQDRFRAVVHAQLLECRPRAILPVDPQRYDSHWFQLLKNGDLAVPGWRTVFSRKHYCMEDFVQDITSAICEIDRKAVVCDGAGRDYGDPVPQLTGGFRKCCGIGAVVDGESLQCVHQQYQYTAGLDTLLQNASVRDQLVVGRPLCLSGSEISHRDDRFHILATGQLHFEAYRAVFNTSQYCIDDFVYSGISGVDVLHQAFLCKRTQAGNLASEEDCRNQTCVPSCCSQEDREWQCLGSSQQLPFISEHGQALQLNYTILYGYSECLGGRSFAIDSNSSEMFFLRSDGSLVWHAHYKNRCPTDMELSVPLNQYCLQYFLDSSSSVQQTYRIRAYVCTEWSMPTPNINRHARHPVHLVSLVVSEVFLLITFIIYFTVPTPRASGHKRKQKMLSSTLPGKILLCQIATLFVAFLLLLIVKFATVWEEDQPQACTALAILLYFFFLASFVWLNIMAFDIWWQFRPSAGSQQKREHSQTRFPRYCLLGWGCPLLLSTVVTVLHFSPHLVSCHLQPGFGRVRCGFQDDDGLAKMLYFTLPVSLTLLLNLVYFGLALFNLLTIFDQSERAKGDTTKVQNKYATKGKKRLTLLFELVIVMGVPWIFEVTLGYVHLSAESQVLYVFDAIIGLRGLLIFLVLVALKPKIRRHITTIVSQRRMSVTTTTTITGSVSQQMPQRASGAASREKQGYQQSSLSSSGTGSTDGYHGVISPSSITCNREKDHTAMKERCYPKRTVSFLDSDTGESESKSDNRCSQRHSLSDSTATSYSLPAADSQDSALYSSPVVGTVNTHVSSPDLRSPLSEDSSWRKTNGAKSSRNELVNTSVNLPERHSPALQTDSSSTSDSTSSHLTATQSTSLEYVSEEVASLGAVVQTLASSNGTHNCGGCHENESPCQTVSDDQEELSSDLDKKPQTVGSDSGDTAHTTPADDTQCEDSSSPAHFTTADTVESEPESVADTSDRGSQPLPPDDPLVTNTDFLVRQDEVLVTQEQV